MPRELEAEFVVRHHHTVPLAVYFPRRTIHFQFLFRASSLFAGSVVIPFDGWSPHDDLQRVQPSGCPATTKTGMLHLRLVLTLTETIKGTLLVYL